MPNKAGGLTQNIAESMDGVLIAIGGRELEDGKVHLSSAVCQPLPFVVTVGLEKTETTGN
jgi:hypothetical protein